MLLGLIGINMIALVSLLVLVSVVYQLVALNRLEQALRNSRLAPPEEKFAVLFMPVIKDDELLSYAGVEIADVLQVDENKPQAEVVVFS